MAGSDGKTLIEGIYFDGRSSARHPAFIALTNGAISITFASGKVIHSPIDAVKFLPRIGKSLSTVHFPDGSSFETDSPDFDSQMKRSRKNRFVAWLEARWISALSLALGTAVLLLLFYRLFLPYFADRVTSLLPHQVSEKISLATEQSLEDSRMVAASELSLKFRERVQRIFARLQRQFPRMKLVLELRRGPGFGANAFALPNGTIYVTDEIVAKLPVDDELLAVLFHEVGHVVNRHGLRTMIEDFGISTINSALSGEVLWTALPNDLLASGYSRNFEREADLFSAMELKKLGLAPRLLAEALRNIEGTQRAQSEVFDPLSSHPSTAERVKWLTSMDADPKTGVH